MPVGARLRLEYLDQNEAFAGMLPRHGTVSRRLETAGANNWYLLDLDTPIEYARIRHDRFLIRSRWEGHEVGEAEPTSVFIVLIPDPSLLDKESIDIDEFELVAWGMSHTE